MDKQQRNAIRYEVSRANTNLPVLKYIANILLAILEEIMVAPEK
jgi:hypothetical protein